MMNFKKGLGKPMRASPPKGGSVSLGGFSFKQLEEDEDGEDLTAYTGKYEKVVEESHKAQKRDNQRTSSTSSISSSASEERKSVDKGKSNSAGDSSKVTSSGSAEGSNSPIKTAAKAKIDSSKELLSGLKDKISDKISKTLEEFSGDSSNSPSPEREKAKQFPVQRTNSFGPVEKEAAAILRAYNPGEEVNLPPAGEVQASAMDESGKDLEQEVSKKEILSSSPSQSSHDSSGTLHSSGPVEDHPLAHVDADEDFEDVIEASENESSSKTKHNSGSDSSEFHDTGSKSDEKNILVFEQHFGGEDIKSPSSGLTTSTQLKPRSKIKRFMKKKDQKTSAVATMSSLHDTPDEEIATLDYKAPHSEKVNSDSHKSDSSTEKRKGQKVFETAPKAILRQLSSENSPLPYQKIITISVMLFAYLIVPLPSYVSGLFMGLMLASLGWALYMWLMKPPSPHEPIKLPPVEEPLPVPEMKITSEADEYIFKGWMNELTDYNPDDYHINKTHSVFVSLEGYHLRIQRPKGPIPKRAMWDEALPKPSFIHQRHYDLPGSTVYLLPHGLVKKRVWSKKYPICIALASPNKHADVDFRMKHNSSDSNLQARKEKTSHMGFEFVTEDKCDNNIIYLFARTCREKEDWYKRFSAAAKGKPLGSHVLEMKRILSSMSVAAPKKNPDSVLRHKREGSTDSAGSTSSLTDNESESGREGEGVDLLTFAHYMGRLMPSSAPLSASSATIYPTSKDLSKGHGSRDGKEGSKSKEGKEGSKNKEGKESEDIKVFSPSGAIVCDSQLFWINALIGRCFFDFLRDQWWTEKVTEKLQRKLSKIHVPYFIEELQVTRIHMGYEMPAIRRAGKPYMDEQGFWIDLDVTYTGGFKMTIETKLNLMKLKKAPHEMSTAEGHSVDGAKSPITHSDEEDSAESSTDEEEVLMANGEDGASGGGTGKKFFRYLNKITQSKYFQQATEYKVVKRAMENVSNTRLVLTVTVNSLVGKLALNIPPPPSDRLWYGFRGNPQLRLSAKPQVGERAVTITHITEWIEKKLAIEFQRVFVMPNMDDLVIPILVPEDLSGFPCTLSRSVSF